jgi:hypothetical protein
MDSTSGFKEHIASTAFTSDIASFSSQYIAYDCQNAAEYLCRLLSLPIVLTYRIKLLLGVRRLIHPKNVKEKPNLVDLGS